MPGKIIVFSSEEVPASAERVLKLAGFVGAEADDCVVLRVEEARSVLQDEDAVVLHADLVCKLSADLLSSILDSRNGRRLALVYGFRPGGDADRLVQLLSGGEVQKIAPSSINGLCSVFLAADVFGPLAGSSFLAARLDIGCTFVSERRSEAVQALAALDGRPFFLRVVSSRADLYFFGATDAPDLDQPCANDESLKSHYFHVIPWIAWFRCALGRRAWRNEAPRACFIIDDPLLVTKYGCINFRELHECVHKHRFSVSIAFIPWNYERSNSEVAVLFKNASDRLSLAVHGCDHTRGEFGSPDLKAVTAMAARARSRMLRHKELFGVPFDDVMVFPQGVFSTAGIEALEANSYLAAINTTLYPVPSDSNLFTLRQLLDVAVLRFANFPLFRRHYPKDVAGLLIDLFLGKPALIVEHHGYFGDAYAAASALVDRLNGLDPSLEWTNLGRICERACLTRRASDERVEVRFFTDRFRYRNESGESRNFIFYRDQWPGNRFLSAKIAGVEGRLRPVVDLTGEVAQMGGFLLPGEEICILLERSAREPVPAPPEPKWKHKSRVRIRRALSEFRDLHVHTNPVLKGMVAKVRSAIQRTRGREVERPSDSAAE